MNDTFV